MYIKLRETYKFKISKRIAGLSQKNQIIFDVYTIYLLKKV